MGLTPACRVLANHRDITALIMERLVALSLTDDSGMASDTLDIVLADHDPARPITMPPAGAELEVFLGYDGVLQRMGLYIVDEIELAGWPGTMTIRGKAAPMIESKEGKSGLQTQKSRSWPNGTKLGDLVAKIAKEHQLQPAVAQSLRGVVLGHVDQTDESDMSLLIRIAKRYDAIAKPADGRLVVAKRGESKSTGGEELARISIAAASVSRWSMTLAKRDAPGTVIAYWHAKRTAKKEAVTVGDGEPVRRLRHWYQDKEAAQAGAQAELDKRARGEHRLTLTLPGDPMIAAESKLVVSGFRTGVDGEWLITRATHSLSKGSGYVCDVEADRPLGSDAEEETTTETKP